VVAAKSQAPARAAPPPPIPVTERPMYLTAHQIPAGGFRANNRPAPSSSYQPQGVTATGWSAPTTGTRQVRGSHEFQSQDSGKEPQEGTSVQSALGPLPIVHLSCILQVITG
jgi:hypothetical protein